MVTAPDAEYNKPLPGQKTDRLRAVTRGSLSTNRIFKREVDLSQRNRRVDSSHRVFDAESLKVNQKTLAKIRDGFVFCCPLSVSWNVRNASGKTALFRVRNYFNRELTHTILSSRDQHPRRITRWRTTCVVSIRIPAS